MYELWLLSIFYRIIKGILQFISRHWIFFLVVILLGVLCSIAVGAFFISLFAFLNHRKEPDRFNKKVLISIVLLLFGFNCLTSDDYIGMPFLYKATAIGNSAGLLMTVLYLERFVSYHFIRQISSQWILGCGSVVAACAAVIMFDHYSHFINYTLANEEDFPAMLQDSKRAKYAADFEALKATHYKLNKHDYYHHDRMQRAYLQRYNNGQDEGEDTLIILNFTHGFRLLYYTYDDNGSYQDVVEKPLLDGFDAEYNNGNLVYNKDSVFTNMDTFSFEQVKHDEHPIYEETDIQLEVIPQTIDDYIAYREHPPMIGEGEIYVSLDYLQSQGIPITLEQYRKGEE